MQKITNLYRNTEEEETQALPAKLQPNIQPFYTTAKKIHQPRRRLRDSEPAGW